MISHPPLGGAFSGRGTIFISPVIDFGHVHYSAIGLYLHQESISIALVYVVCYIFEFRWTLCSYTRKVSEEALILGYIVFVYSMFRNRLFPTDLKDLVYYIIIILCR